VIIKNPRTKRGFFSYNKDMKRIMLFCLVSLALGACHKEGDSLLAGGDRDEHNCIASAGYTWSQTRQSCVRVWEEGFALFDTQDKASSVAAFVLVSDNYARMEVFLPTQPGFVLSESGSAHNEWTAPNLPWKLLHTGSSWQLLEKGRVRYEGRPVQAD